MRETFIAPESLKPPVLPAPDAILSGSPAVVMLDEVAYIGHRKNGTFAQAITRTGGAIGVSLWLTDPPAVSHLCIHCSGFKVTDLIDEPTVVCSGKDIAIIRVIYNPGVRPIQTIEEMGMADCDYLLYRATNPPSLEVLPNPKPNVFHPSEIGFFPCGDGGDFFMAVLRPKIVHLQYNLHIFSSQTNTWTTKLALLEPPSPGYKEDYLVHENDMVITLERGLLGWVDLWRGILLCSVLDTHPVVRYIQFPRPMDGNMLQYLQNPARTIRDVTSSDGLIKLIEIEHQKRLVPTATVSDGSLTSVLEAENRRGVYATESYMPGDGWTVVTWSIDPSLDSWRQDCVSHVTASSIMHLLRYNHSDCSARKTLVMAGPLWGVRGGDVVYLMAKSDFNDKHAWAIAFNIRKSTLDGVTSFPAGRVEFFKLAYQPFALSKLTSAAAASACRFPEREDSRNDPDNTMVLVEGLGPCLTVNKLKDIVAMFGELCYLKVHAEGQYGLVKFVSRSYAEQAISALNGSLIDKQRLCLSWRPRPSNRNRQPPPQQMLRECNRTRYHPYGVSSCNKFAGRGNYEYGDSTLPGSNYDLQQQSSMATPEAATDRSTSGSICALQRQRKQTLIGDNYITHQE